MTCVSKNQCTCRYKHYFILQLINSVNTVCHIIHFHKIWVLKSKEASILQALQKVGYSLMLYIMVKFLANLFRKMYLKIFKLSFLLFYTKYIYTTNLTCMQHKSNWVVPITEYLLHINEFNIILFSYAKK